MSLGLLVPGFAEGISPDTAHLAAKLQRFRPYKVYEMSAAEYRSIKAEYWAWIDSRMRTGATISAMNQELEAAALVWDGAQTVDRTYAGYLGKIEHQSLQLPDGLLAVKFGIYTGGACNFDETVVIYRRDPFQQVVSINAERSYTHGFYLRALAVGSDFPASGAFIGSAWVMSNCTSNWNGNAFRIDVLTPGRSIRNILNHDVSAYGGDDVRIAIDHGTVRFEYTTLAGDTAVLIRAAIECYKIQGDRAIRIAPIAPTFGGFVGEWLDVSDAEAAKWSTAQAMRRHHELATRRAKGTFEFEYVGECPGPPATWEIGVQWEDPKEETVFAVSGARAAEMRMLSLSDQRGKSCREVELDKGIPRIFSQPAR